MPEDFSSHMQDQRNWLNESRQNWLEAKQQADNELAEIERELAALDAYEAAKTGKQNKPAAKAEAGTRARRGSKREAILNTLNAAPLGMTRGELIVALGVKGDKSGEMSVSNGLTALQRMGRVTRREDGHWVISVPLQEAA